MFFCVLLLPHLLQGGWQSSPPLQALVLLLNPHSNHTLRSLANSSRRWRPTPRQHQSSATTLRWRSQTWTSDGGGPCLFFPILSVLQGKQGAA